MIKSIKSGGKWYEFITDSFDGDSKKNIFTVMIGKNGTGKSRLLKDIVYNLTGQEDKNDIEYINFAFENKTNFSKIIALSTTPFDKFPIAKPDYNIKKKKHSYDYIGIKDCLGFDISKTFLRKVLGSYLQAYLSGDTKSLAKTLDYLGYHRRITLKFSYIGGSIIKRICFSDTHNPEAELYYYLSERANRGEYHLYDYLNKIRYSSPEMFPLSSLLQSLKNLPQIHNIRKMNINIDNDCISLSKPDIPFNNDLINLIAAGVLKLETAHIQKQNSAEIFRIHDASSGEQCVILSMLGISSLIEDNSLILVDEPEVCLHPEWQEKYIQLLTTVFKSYKGCHFIVATHSPQIISNLSLDQCFVLKMDDGKAYNANSFINKSSDFQLATLFGSPGFKNEYLSRLAVALFSKMTAKKVFDDKDTQTLEVLSNSLHLLSINDPLYELINVILQAGRLYGRDK